ncbi:hypothetical protein HU200_004661 [Digitaria exilis]|uniref:Uncharacterized protein n=1 Tax=Digitaria exilis TaxID=1010633 RepID=A0A835KTH2_9POAL|nr:hypothetical protein HU200_004661 [Digitaria exilis]
MAPRSRLDVLVIIFAFAAGALLLATSCAAATAMGFPGDAGGRMLSSLDAQRRVEEDDASSLVEAEELAAAYPRRRALYSGGYISYGALAASKAACYGPCPARGQAYSRGCEAIYQCRG